jgi:hypothetical protein
MYEFMQAGGRNGTKGKMSCTCLILVRRPSISLVTAQCNVELLKEKGWQHSTNNIGII